MEVREKKEKMIEKIVGSKTHLKVVLYLYKLSKVRNRTTMKELIQKTGMSRTILIKVIKDLMKAKIVMIIGATKGQIIMITNTPQKNIVWKFIKDFENSFYRVTKAK